MCDCCLGGEHLGEEERDSIGVGTGPAPVQLEPQPDPTAGLGALAHESHPTRLFPPEVRGGRSLLLCQLVTGLGSGGTGLGGVELLLGQDNHCLAQAVLWRGHSCEMCHPSSCTHGAGHTALQIVIPLL